MFGCNESGGGGGDTPPIVDAESTYYRDSDNDGYGDSTKSIKDTTKPSGYVTNSNDCDDSDETINPSLEEICDGIDNNCNGNIDEGLDSCQIITYYFDSDGDGYGNISTSVEGYTQPSGYVTSSGDCDDSDENINPNAEEICDWIDNDCNGGVDEGFNTSCQRITYYLDSDSDGYGDPNQSTQNYTQPLGYVLNNNDCDDSDETINPSAEEICNGIDNDCDGDIDEGFNDSCTKITYYFDSDGDGYGDISESVEDYTQPLGFVTNSNDCNDSDETINTSAEETCDSIDNNCNGSVDEGFNDSCTEFTYYYDNDKDGYGDPNTSIEGYTQPLDYVPSSSDCDDSDENVNPSAEEMCDNIDNDCDGDIDEGFNDSCQYVVSLIAVEDTRANEGDPDENYGGDHLLRTGDADSNWNEANQVSFVKFDLSSIPDDATVVDANFHMYGIDYGGSISPSGDVWVYQISDYDWAEYELTYNNMPMGYSQFAVKEINEFNGELINWDVTSLVNSWLGGAPNYGMMINADATNEYYASGIATVIFYSRNWCNSSYGSCPALEIVYEVAEDSSSE